MNDFSLGTIRFIGIAGSSAPSALILPGATGIAAVLTPIAAVCLAKTMVRRGGPRPSWRNAGDRRERRTAGARAVRRRHAVRLTHSGPNVLGPPPHPSAPPERHSKAIIATIAVFGATGQLGRLTIDALLARGVAADRIRASDATPNASPNSPTRA